MELYPGVLDFIKFCTEKKIKLYMLTNNLCKEQLDKLGAFGITGYFSKIYTTEEFGVEKPDIKMFYYILADIGCHKNDIVKIGDSYRNDVESVNLYDIYSFWFNTKPLRITPDYLEFNQYGDLLQLFQTYYEEATAFIDMSNHLGERFDLTQAGGGNTSFKMGPVMFIKSSGCQLSDLAINRNYVGIDYNRVKHDLEGTHPPCSCSDSVLFLKGYRPSIETTLHTITRKYTAHIHPIQFNKISALPSCNEIIPQLFTDNYVILDYITPGIDVTRQLLPVYKNQPIIFLKNHGIVCTADTIDELYKILDTTIHKLEQYLHLDLKQYHFVNDISVAMKEVYSESFVSYLVEDSYINASISRAIEMDELATIFQPFVPDKVVYCGTNYVDLDRNVDVGVDVNLREKITQYQDTYQEKPKLFLRRETNCLYISSSSLTKCREIESVLKAHLMCYHPNNNLLKEEELYYLNHWDAETFRQNIK